jgi:hypothetical protein
VVEIWRTADGRDGSRQLRILEGRRSSNEMMLTVTGGEAGSVRLGVVRGAPGGVDVLRWCLDAAK